MMMKSGVEFFYFEILLALQKYLLTCQDNSAVLGGSSVPNVIFLQAPEFSGQLVRSKNYDNGHKNTFGLSVVLESKVKNSKNPSF